MLIYNLNKHYTGLQGFVVEKLWVVSRVIFVVESESGIRVSPSGQDFEIFDVMCSKNGVARLTFSFTRWPAVLKCRTEIYGENNIGL